MALGMLVLVLGLARGAESAERVAVLEFRGSGSGLSSGERDYLVDSVVRGAVRRTLPPERYIVMTKETMIELLQGQGISFETVCEGACELEVGRKIGAHYIVTGSCWRVGGKHQVAIKLYDTKSGNLLSQETVSGVDVEGLSGTLAMATRAILAGLLAAGPAGVPGTWGSLADEGRASSAGSGTVRTEAGGTAVPGSGPHEGMVLIPGGTFWMGCVPGDGECFGDEKPRHQVTVSPFWMDTHEVTVAQYEECVNAGVCKVPFVDEGGEYYNWGRPGRRNHPVNGVDWSDAVGYCEWRGKRLPTEAEWEYAARGGKEGEVRYGQLDSVAWYEGNSGGRTHPVGQKLPNGYGLYDMLGNVWEWCWDWYDDGYYGRSPSRDPRGPESGTSRVLRGGSWYD